MQKYTHYQIYSFNNNYSVGILKQDKSKWSFAPREESYVAFKTSDEAMEYCFNIVKEDKGDKVIVTESETLKVYKLNDSTDWIVDHIFNPKCGVDDYWCDTVDQANQLAYEIANNIEDGMLLDYMG